MKKMGLNMFLTMLMMLISMATINIINPVFSQNSFDEDEKINISVYEKVSNSVVGIDAELTDGVSSGTGCIIDNKGIILTSSHVIEGSDNIKVTLPDGAEKKAKVIEVMGENNDLALLKIENGKSLKTIKLGDSTKIKVGQKVLALGNPFGFNGTLTTGIISRIDYKRNKIQTDAAINPGSSGGPLVNSSGEVIGINQSIYNPDNNKSNIGIGFAVPVNAANRFIAKVVKDTNSFEKLVLKK